MVRILYLIDYLKLLAVPLVRTQLATYRYIYCAGKKIFALRRKIIFRGTLHLLSRHPAGSKPAARVLIFATDVSSSVRVRR